MSAHEGGVQGGGSAHRRQLLTTLALTGSVFVAEVVGALVTRSLALLVDAGHMMTDMAVLIASTVTAVLMERRPTNRRTWGWSRLEVITAAGGALVLLAVGVYAIVEAVLRLWSPGRDQVHQQGLLLFFGILGLAANVGSILVLASGHKDNLNMRAAFLEVVNDALGSVAVLVSAVVMMLTGWAGFDAVAGALIALLMIPRAIKLLASSVSVLLEETPADLDMAKVRKHLEGVPGVLEVHDLHANSVSTGLPQLTAHVVVRQGTTAVENERILTSMQRCLRNHFPVSVEHTTFQIEPQGHRDSSGEHLDM
ncbi:cation transporter [Bifidobacterium sp. W8113]|uniref:cation diffusion facilitator family transporter n=1 Tax=Bifidobacterium TaxID=1678 RepID=UPI0018DC7114|nr:MULTISPECIES: cation diffusion facilitator family transporter [Bifidobacterium]MBI0090207.1 cation transporter [Bifidobacterium choladohabitans]MBI0125723.1 cation transporter [Bifidobacterium choladohabitans]MBI0127292.1 cation transporter [Bifidobacterium sp. W8103]MBI0137880.1 cation transporter [Bifidobacterium sp. W8105]MBI0149149.1 cation transporter [Bifidobacterium sp. W8107]